MTAEHLAGHLWSDSPPRNERAALHIHMTRLRQALTQADPRLSDAIVTEPGGYRLSMPGLMVDLAIYRDAESKADRARARRSPEGEYYHLQHALGLWRGELLEDVPFRSLHREEDLQLRESRLTLRERYHELEILRGRPDQAVVGLRALVAAHPLRESAWHLLMRALVGAGRGAEAVATFGTVRELLAEQLGVGPCIELRELFQELLKSERAGVGRPALTGR